MLIANEQILAWFNGTFEYVIEEANIPLEIIDNNKNEDGGINFYIDEFKKKCADKNLNPADFPKKIDMRLPQYKGRWESSISEQIKELPDFVRVNREVQRNIRKLEF